MNSWGFATPVALGFSLLMALLAVSALQDAGLSGSLASARLFHHRAFAAGEIGLAQVAAELAIPGVPVPVSAASACHCIPPTAPTPVSPRFSPRRCLPDSVPVASSSGISKCKASGVQHVARALSW